MTSFAFELLLRHHLKLSAQNPAAKSPGRIHCVAKPGAPAQPNNSFKPSPFRGLVFAVTFTTTLGRYAGRLNPGVSTHEIHHRNHRMLRLDFMHQDS